MIETGREGQSVYLRAYEDAYQHSLKVTERNEPGLGHMSFRASSKNALERRVKILKNQVTVEVGLKAILVMEQLINLSLLIIIGWKFFGKLKSIRRKKVKELY